MSAKPDPAEPSAFTLIVSMAVAIGAMHAILFATADMICLPEYVPVTGGGKMEGIFQTLRLAVAHPLLFFPLLVGFSLIAAAVAVFPTVFVLPSAGRTTAGFGIILLLIGGVAYGVYALPRAQCDGTWNGIRILLQVLIAVIVWCIVLLLCFRKDRRGV